MPRKKETIGRRYGIAIAKEYFGRNLPDEALEKSGARAKAKLYRAIDEDPELLTEEDAEEAGAYLSAIDVWQGMRMAASAYAFQAVGYANLAARLIQEVIDAETAHTRTCARPVLTFTGEGGETLVDAEGEDEQKITLTDLADLEPAEDPEGFIADMKSNDLFGRMGLVGQSVLVTKDADKERRRRLQEEDREWHENYELLFELRRDGLKAFLDRARNTLETCAFYLDRYYFTAQLVEAFLKIEGAGDGIAPEAIISTARESGIDVFNDSVGMLGRGSFIMRYNVTPEMSDPAKLNMAQGGLEYVDAMLNEAREWLTPVEWTDRSEDLKKAAKAAAKEMTHEDIGRIARLEGFAIRQMKKRGLV